jgi:2-desacetyl-2-hydroxyethyl bacteriochlorophyllide A dehydrogenase
VVRGPGLVALEAVAPPAADPGSLQVRPVMVGLCGTDLEIIDGRIDPAYVRLPLVIGHEWTGVVARPAPGAETVAAGTRVVVEGIVPCRHCPACVSGATNRCETYDEFGFVRAGAAAELVSAPSTLVHPIASTVSDESATLVEPASVVLRALERAAPSPGMTVLVVGDGTVGLLATTLVRLWSPASVTMLGARSSQRTLAEAAGADDFRLAPDSSKGYDLVIEAAGAPAAVSTALASPTRGGTVVLLGLAGAAVSTPLLIDNLVNADVTVMGSFSYTAAAWAKVVDLLNTGRLDLTFLVTHRYPLAEWAQALAALRAPQGARGKVVLILDP